MHNGLASPEEAVDEMEIQKDQDVLVVPRKAQHVLTPFFQIGLRKERAYSLVDRVTARLQKVLEGARTSRKRFDDALFREEKVVSLEPLLDKKLRVQAPASSAPAHLHVSILIETGHRFSAGALPQGLPRPTQVKYNVRGPRVHVVTWSVISPIEPLRMKTV